MALKLEAILEKKLSMPRPKNRITLSAFGAARANRNHMWVPEQRP
jgi:hypothetical protein